MFADDASLLGGPTGWAGAGLLGLVLAWLLLKHLPEKDRNARYVVDALLNEARHQREAHERALVRVCEEFRNALASREGKSDG